MRGVTVLEVEGLGSSSLSVVLSLGSGENKAAFSGFVAVPVNTACSLFPLYIVSVTALIIALFLRSGGGVLAPGYRTLPNGGFSGTLSIDAGEAGGYGRAGLFCLGAVFTLSGYNSARTFLGGRGLETGSVSFSGDGSCGLVAGFELDPA